MKRTSTRRARREPRRLGALVLASFALTIVTFVGAGWLADRRAHGIAADAKRITTNAMPSIAHLSNMRIALRRVERTLDSCIGGGAAAPSVDQCASAVEVERRNIREEWSKYLALQSYREEREEWSSLRAMKATADASVDAILARLRDGDREAAAALLDNRARPIIGGLIEGLRGAQTINTESALTLSTRIMSLRRASRSWMFVLDGLSAFFAVVAALATVRLVRRYASLMEYRLSELETFAGRVAHDIRSPLASVGLVLNLAERDAQTTPSQRAMVARGSQTLQRVGQLIDGLLVFARAGAAPTEKTPSDLQPIINDVIESLRSTAAEKGTELRVEERKSCAVACSAGVLTSIISNLVENAIKHMDDAAIRRVTVRTVCAPKIARVEIEDTGPGIAEELIPKIFDPYVRGLGSSALGLGLGLATVRRLVEAHDGVVGVQSSEGSGSCFWIELPRA